MADLVTTISESVTLNSAVRGSSNSVTTTGVNNVMERIVTCINGNVTTIATFATTPHTSAGAIDVENVRYVRVTNLDTTNSIELAVVTTGTNYQVTLTGGNSHILSIGEEVAIGETDTSPAFGTLEDLASLQVSPKTADAQVELFVGLV